jgi:hypothetical protein
VAASTGFRLRRCLALCGAVLLADLPAHTADRPAGGIWKYAVPPAAIRGEFNNEDPLGLAAGVHIRTDCSMNWVADGGEVYCFTTGTSLLVFQESPQAYLARARRFFHERPQAP